MGAAVLGELETQAVDLPDSSSAAIGWTLPWRRTTRASHSEF
jgi:hypothetical protein